MYANTCMCNTFLHIHMFIHVQLLENRLIWRDNIHPVREVKISRKITFLIHFVNSLQTFENYYSTIMSR